MRYSHEEHVPLAEVVVLSAATLGLIASLLPWHQGSISALGTRPEVNAWRAGVSAWLSMLILIVAAGVVLAGGATATRTASPWCWPLIVGLALFSALCLIAHWFSWQSPSVGGGPDHAVMDSARLHESDASGGPAVGLYLAMLATAVVAAASILSVRAQRKRGGHTSYK
jgi:hypothetical protein